MADGPDEFSDELMSAYLDGEATSEQRVQVEQRLAQDPRSRQTFEELRALSETLRSLPRQTADPQFCERVMQRVQTESETPTVNAAARVGDARSPVRPSDRGWRRGLWWASAAVAVAVLLSVFSPPQPQPDLLERTLSRNDQPTRERGRVTAPRPARKPSELRNRNVEEPVKSRGAGGVAPGPMDLARGGVERPPTSSSIAAGRVAPQPPALEPEDKLTTDQERRLSLGGAMEEAAPAAAALAAPAPASDVAADHDANASLSPDSPPAELVVHLRVAGGEPRIQQLTTSFFKQQVPVLGRYVQELRSTAREADGVRAKREPEEGPYRWSAVPSSDATLDERRDGDEPWAEDRGAAQLVVVRALPGQIVQALADAQQQGEVEVLAVNAAAELQAQAVRRLAEQGPRGVVTSREFRSAQQLGQAAQGDRPLDAGSAGSKATLEPARPEPTAVASERSRVADAKGELTEEMIEELSEQTDLQQANAATAGARLPERSLGFQFTEALRSYGLSQTPQDRMANSADAKQQTADARRRIAVDPLRQLATTGAAQPIRVLVILHPGTPAVTAAPSAESAPEPAAETLAPETQGEPAGTTPPASPR